MTTYEIKVKTGDRFGAGTDANVEIVLLDGSGRKTKPAFLDNWLKNDFEARQLDVFTIKDDTDIPDVTEIKIRRDQAGLFSDWYVEKIEVLNKRSGTASVFPILRWIRPDVDLYVGKFDTFLPQFDPRRDQRNAELELKKTLYEYEEKVPGLPVQVKKVPEDEQFSNSAKWDLLKRKLSLLAGKSVEMIFGSGSWETLEDLTGVYLKTFGDPKEMENWKSDEHFGWQRLNSVNPNLIRVCTEIPSKFGVTDECIKECLDGLTLSEAMSKKRLFIVDLEILDGITCVEGYISPVPIALFFVNGTGKLMPVAIQLFQQKGPENPVFVPTDPPYTWLFAKMWYNVADSNYHQALTHLGGWIDKTMAIGAVGILELTKKGADSWRMNIEGNYAEFLNSRGVYCCDGSILPTFYQRDDSMVLYGAIRDYVTKYVNLYYDTNDKIINDVEIQTFGQELTKSKSDGGCGIPGVPFENGKFSKADQLIEVFTSVIFSSSVVHAAANFPQYDAYGFPPNYPTKIKGVPPKNKNPLKEEDIVKSLIDKSTTLDTMVITRILSERSTNALGDFEVTYTYDPAAVKIVEEFRQNLKDISLKMHQRNEKLVQKYEYLYPEEIPNSISI